MKRTTIAALAACVLLASWWFWLARPAASQDTALEAQLDSVRDAYRKVIVLMDGVESLDDATRARSTMAARILFTQKQALLESLEQRLSGRRTGTRQFVDYVSNNSSLHDADKLAFLDLVEGLQASAPRFGFGRSSPASSLKALLDNLESIQLTYREEVTRIFSQFATRGASGNREKWEAYVAFLHTLWTRDKILPEFAGLPLEEFEGANTRGPHTEFFGNDFPPNTVALTFDDGPHPRYTEQVLALLHKYGLRACFFELGKNIGDVTGPDQVTLKPTARISKEVLDAGSLIANHTYSHRVLTKLTEDERHWEIDRTSLLLEKVMGRKPELFRAPYGARDDQILDQITAAGMKSVMWNIDSLDWADPIPESIAMRVLHQLSRTHKGIILFHDIHKQSVMALTPVLEELTRQDYNFVSYNDGKFGKLAPPIVTQRSEPTVVQPVSATLSPESRSKYYRESWAIIVGINDYQSWPKLSYAVNDATAIEQALITQFGYKPGNIRKLINGEATRQRILEVLGDEFSDEKKVQREDKVFFFFAGHGATRTLPDGRQIGFLIPVDADRENYYSTAISMNALRDACDEIAAKHIYFVMDSCYSGMALSRGAGAFERDHSYLEEVTRRVARQILTAGGAEQSVADDGPNGHSVFTWALLEGLRGPADLDGNGVITASELGAYVSPIVARFSRQTPAMGNLVGSEGGEFLFELHPQPLSAQSEQLEGKALNLAEQLDALQKQVAAKQQELLKLQQSVRAEGDRLAELKHAGVAPPEPVTRPLRAYDLDRQGRQLYREHKSDEAIDKLRQAVSLKPSDPVLLNNLGFLYFEAGRYDDAEKCLEQTLTLDPRRKEAHGNLADTLLKLGRRGEAKSQYEQYLTLYPNSPRAAEVRRILGELSAGG